MSTASTATLHPFPRLPFELRALIWELSLEPRTIELRVVHHPFVVPQTTDLKVNPPLAVRQLRSSTPVPPQLQTCREARGHLTTHPNADSLYEKSSSDITGNPHSGHESAPEGDPERERYVWVNFENDTPSIGKTDRHIVLPVAHRIRRLRLERATADEYSDITDFSIGYDFSIEYPARCVEAY